MAKPKLGSGTRFKALSTKLAAKGASNPGALAAWIGRKKYGKKKFQSLSVGGKKPKGGSNPMEGNKLPFQMGPGAAWMSDSRPRGKSFAKGD